MLTLYGHVNPLSINTFKLRVPLAEAGAEFRYFPVDLLTGAQRRSEFLALNPHGKIPVLVDDDFALPESDAILWYIAEIFPSARLHGETPRQRARILQWCDFASTTLYPAYADVYVHTQYNPPEQRLSHVANKALEKLTRALPVLDEALARQETLVGHFSIADIGAAVVVRNIRERLSVDWSALPNVVAWFGRVSNRPAWQMAAQARL